MPSKVNDDIIKNPLKFIAEELFTEQSNIDQVEELAAQFKRSIIDVDCIPFLNNTSSYSDLPDSSLVRFRAMVQNNGLSHEYFPISSTFINDDGETKLFSNLFTDSTWTPENVSWTMEAGEIQNAMSSGKVMEKRPLVAVPIPSETSWSKVKSLKNEQIRETTKEPVLVKIYKQEDEEDFKLNSVYEFIGVLQHPELEQQLEELGFDDSEEALGKYFRLHAIIVNELPNGAHPLLLKNEEFDIKNYDVSSLRKNLKENLTSILYGDDLAAEYLICHLFSNFALSDSIGTSGFPLNLFNFDEIESTDDFENSVQQQLYKSLALLVDKCKYVPLSLDVLNNSIFAPCMDNGGMDKAPPARKEEEEETEKEPIVEYGMLKPGELQLVDGSHLILDESQLQTGTLFERGLRNFGAVTELVANGTVPFVVGGAVLKVEQKLGLLVLGSSKTLFQVDVKIPIEKSSDCVKPNSVTEQEWMGDLRVVLSNVAFNWDKYSIPEDVSANITDYFVENRKINAKYNQMDLTRTLKVARALSLSHGLFELDLAIWESAVKYEELRLNRVATFIRK